MRGGMYIARAGADSFDLDNSVLEHVEVLNTSLIEEVECDRGDVADEGAELGDRIDRRGRRS